MWIATALLIIVLGIIIIVSLVLAFALVTLTEEDDKARQFKKAAVATDVPECSEMGSSILKDGGSAVDAAITSMLCIGLVNGQSSGIGGGAVMLVYDRKAKESKFIDFRETAPAATTPEIFNDDTITYGGLAVATPGEVKGMWEAHQKYGRLSWKELFEPVIALARKGFRFTKHAAHALCLTNGKFNLKAWQVFLKDNGTRPKEEGDTVVRSKYADTLQRIADNGWTEFYNGTTSDMIIEDIQLFNGTMTKDDLMNYSVLWPDVLTTSFKGNTVVSPSMATGGSVYQFIINVMKGYDIDVSTYAAEVRTIHRFIETCKFASGLKAYLGDVNTPEVLKALDELASEEYADKIRDTIKDDMVTYTNASCYSREVDATDNLGGTSHISVLAEDGDAVTVTTSVNYYFGSRIISASSGIIYNNLMADFTLPNTEAEYQPSNDANYPAPNKRALSSMSGSILLDESGDVSLVVGSSGGKHIITANAWVTLVAMATDTSLADAIEYRRIHNQLFPNIGLYDVGFSQTVLAGLEDLGQVVEEGKPFAVVQAILKDEHGIDAHSDSRKQGKAAGY